MIPSGVWNEIRKDGLLVVFKIFILKIIRRKTYFEIQNYKIKEENFFVIWDFELGARS